MSTDLAHDLVVCGGLLAGVCGLARHLHPDFPLHTLWVGLSGGGLCVLWGILAGRRRHVRPGAMLTLGTVACVLAWQAVRYWGVSGDGPAKIRIVAVLLTVLVVFCIGTWANLLHETTAPPNSDAGPGRRRGEPRD